jgi:hypothetical protein
MSNNTNYGLGSLQKNSGTNNTGIGAYASYNNLDGYNNTSVGSNSSFFNTTGSNNTSMGAGSMCNNTTGSLNTAVGSSALEGLTGPVGDQNTAIGVQSLYTNQGTQNTAIGAYAALGVIGGNYNTFLGANSSTLNDANYNYSTALGYNAKIDASNQIMMGGTGPSGYPNVIIPGNAYLPNFTTATSNDQIVPKSYVDLVAGGLKPTQACICATTENIDLSLNTAPSVSSTDGFDLSTLSDGTYNILVVNQDGSSNTLTSSVGNGVYKLNKNGSLYTWSRPPSNEPMCIGFDATGAFSLVKFGNTYSKQGLVQINNPGTVGTNALRYETVFQLGYELGQGLNATTVGLNVYINVDSSLNFINFLDSTTGVTGASGTLALGTNSTNTVIGPTGGNPIQIQSQIEAQKGITGPTGSFTDLIVSDLIVSNEIKASGGITGTTGSFRDLIVSNQIKASGGITGSTGSFTDLTTSNQIKASGGITGSTGSFTYLTSSNNTYLATSSGGVGIGRTSTSFTLDVNGGTRISTTNLGGSTTLILRDNTTGNEMRFALNCTAANYNPLVQAGDQVICAAPTSGEVLTLCSNSTTTTSGVRITTSSVTMGLGGSTSTPTTAVITDASGVSVRPQLTFPDNTVQTTAFTGGPAGTYTIPNITLDANGRISSISNAYTNGSWQPVIGGQTGTATTYEKRNGKYIVINNLCTVQCEVKVINIGSSLGAMYVSLPFTCDTLVPASFAIGSISGLTSASTNYIDFSLFAQENTNYALFLYRATVGATSYINLQNTNINASISNPFTIRFTGSYIIA